MKLYDVVSSNRVYMTCSMIKLKNRMTGYSVVVILAYESSAEPLSKSNILQEQTIEEKSRTNADIQQ